MIKREDQTRRALEEQETVAKEMSHRLKNLFAITDGMIHASAKSAKTPEQLAETLSGRLHALASAHSLVHRKVSDRASDAAPTDLTSLIQTVLAAHGVGAERGAPSIFIEGPPVSCSDRATNGLAMIFHELATNATKYGALATDGGQVAIRWQLADDKVHLTWTEAGGPQITSAPDRIGFGSTLIARTVKTQFRGTIERDWGLEGLTVTMVISLRKMSE